MIAHERSRVKRKSAWVCVRARMFARACGGSIGAFPCLGEMEAKRKSRVLGTILEGKRQMPALYINHGTMCTFCVGVWVVGVFTANCLLKEAP